MINCADVLAFDQVVPLQPGVLSAKPGRLLIFSPDGYGLGHMRRTLAIASAVNTALPGTAILALSSSNHLSAYDLPETFDYIKLPSVSKDKSGAYISHRLPITIDRSLRMRERIIQEAVESFQPHVILVDHAPVGLRGELRNTLAMVKRIAPETRLILGMRDIIDEPAAVRSAWIAEDIYPVLEQLYDDILVYGDPAIFNPLTEYGLSPSVAAKTTFCGYIQKPELLQPARSIRTHLGVEDQKLVVVTTGGGGDGCRIIQNYLEMLQRFPDPTIMSCVIPGPLADAQRLRAITHLAAQQPNVKVVTFTPHLTSYLNAADLVISMGGYNSMTEVAYLGKRTIAIPRTHPRREQAIRVERFSQHGIVSTLPMDTLCPDSLRAAVLSALAAPEPNAHLPFDGLQRAQELITQRLENASAPMTARSTAND